MPYAKYYGDTGDYLSRGPLYIRTAARAAVSAGTGDMDDIYIMTG